jgi:cytochrome bd-type quinol oxidase subunit 1
MSDRSQYALFVLPVAFTWLMGLMGYIRSSLRTHWHVYTIMKDNSAEAYIPTIGQAGNTITVITLMFMAVMVFVFWLSRLGETKQAEPEADEPEGDEARA